MSSRHRIVGQPSANSDSRALLRLAAPLADPAPSPLNGLFRLGQPKAVPPAKRQFRRQIINGVIRYIPA
jgi:hypothetical protein